MKLRHAAASPFVRKVMVVAHEHGLADCVELVPTTVSPVQANESLAPENPLMKVPSLTMVLRLAEALDCRVYDLVEVFEKSGRARKRRNS